MLHLVHLLLLMSILQETIHQVASTDCPGGKVSNEVWNDGSCKRCTCTKGSIECTDTCKKKILRQESPETVKKPKSLLEYSCWHDNIKRSDNESWHETGKHAKPKAKAKGECMQCHCNKKIVTCTIRRCPHIKCRTPIRKEGSCCLSCPDKKTVKTKEPVCHQSGSTFEKEATWKMYVPVQKGHGHCLRCRCNKLTKNVCVRHQCPILTCNNPVGKPGRCCGICRDSTKRTRSVNPFKRNEYINQMMTDIFRVIETRGPPAKREDVGASTDALNVSHHKMLRRGHKDCVFGGREIYKHGEHFTPKISSCLRCHCQNKNVKCSKIVCPTSYECAKPSNQPGLCCKVCPGITVMKAQRNEEKNVVKITKKSSGCGRTRTDYIQVYQVYYPTDESTSIVRRLYLFHRLNKNKRSELHDWQLSGEKTNVDVETVGDVNQLMSETQSKYLGYIKERILKRIHRHERELKGLRGRVKCILKIEAMKKIISEKVRKRRHCKSLAGISDTSSVLKGLQEVG